jgi:adenosylmethionine-8-amino-7-oxononanoate aminotransferase
MNSDWFDKGYQHIWLPYNQMKTSPAPLSVVSTQGSRIKLADGRELVDGVASWWSAAHGYNHPYIAEAVKKQLEVMPHVMFGGLVHEPALTLAKRLCGMLPGNMQRVFFSDSGSTAVEVALKMALQYWRNMGQPKRDKFICFRNGYHGDTMGAMSVSEPESLNRTFRHLTHKNLIVDIPNDEYSFAEFKSMIEGLHKSVAGMIIEPLVQGAEGMKFHSPDVLSEIHHIAREFDIVFIADEIATGFGRTGSMFACQEAGIDPDIICLGKALTGGTMTLAATVTNAKIFDGFLSDDPDYALMHGPTYMANPLACAAANASLDLFEREPRLTQVEQIEQHLLKDLAACESIEGVVDVRVKGAIGVVELEASKMDKIWLREQFVERGVWLRPLKNVVYILPALNIEQADLLRLTSAVKDVLQEWSKR